MTSTNGERIRTNPEELGEGQNDLSILLPHGGRLRDVHNDTPMEVLSLSPGDGP
jgi:hypothetical protein